MSTRFERSMSGELSVAAGQISCLEGELHLFNFKLSDTVDHGAGHEPNGLASCIISFLFVSLYKHKSLVMRHTELCIALQTRVPPALFPFATIC